MNKRKLYVFNPEHDLALAMVMRILMLLVQLVLLEKMPHICHCGMPRKIL
jgi:hypothetical protein